MLIDIFVHTYVECRTEFTVKSTSNPRQIHVKYGIEHRFHLFNQTRDSISYKESHNILCMGSRIPKPIRLEALRKWLDGKFRDDIAKELQISQGAVSSIINDFRKDDSQFDLLRSCRKN